MKINPKDFPDSQLREFARQVNNRPFRVSFFGKMKTGKSSVVNALLGASVLPVKTITATAVQTNITYADTAAEVVFLNGSRELMSIEAAKDHIVYAKDKPRMVKEVNISLPCDYLLNDVIFTDTPGIDDLGSLNKIAESVIDETDLAVMICDATRFIAESERIFAAKLNKRLDGNVIFVINRSDLIDDADELDAIANVYLRTFGNKLTGTPTIVYTAVPLRGEKEIDALRTVLSKLILNHKKELCENARKTILLHYVDAVQSSLIDKRSDTENQLRDKETESLMEYMARLNKVRKRTPEIVKSFESTCVDIIGGENGLLTLNNMAYCLNRIADAFVEKFNINLSKLKKEFAISGGSQVQKLPNVTRVDLSAWGIGAFYDDTMNKSVFSEIMRVHRKKLTRSIESAFAAEERRISKIISDTERIVKSGSLTELESRILSCAQTLEKLESR